MNTLSPITAESGTELRWTFQIRNKATGLIVDPAGYVITVQIKDKPESSTALLVASTANGKITYDGSAVVVRFLSSEFTVPSRQLPYYLGVQVAPPGGLAWKTKKFQLVVNPKFIV